MKVLMIHNFYRSSSPSGEDAVFQAEADLFRRRGVEVVRYEKSNDAINGNRKWTAAHRVIWAKDTYAELTELIRCEKPDVAHFHNIWYLISPSAYYACKAAGIAVVQTLHNFRMFCANGLLLRDGRVCEECVGKFPWRGIYHGCYRDSRLYSAPVVAADIFHRAKKTWAETIDAFVTLTDFGREKFIQCGLPAEKIFVKPNFLLNPPMPRYDAGDYAIYVGRLSAEKGLDTLLDALMLLNHTASSPLQVKIVGDGPLRKHLEQRVRDSSLPGIEFLGRRDYGQGLALLSRASYLIMPSVCYENFPMAICEAYACGKPVVASRLGAVAEIVHDKSTGLLFDARDSTDLSAKLRWMKENEDACSEMGRCGRAEFEKSYGADRNFDMLMDIYRKAASSKGT